MYSFIRKQKQATKGREREDWKSRMKTGRTVTKLPALWNAGGRLRAFVPIRGGMAGSPPLGSAPVLSAGNGPAIEVRRAWRERGETQHCDFRVKATASTLCAFGPCLILLRKPARRLLWNVWDAAHLALTFLTDPRGWNELGKGPFLAAAFPGLRPPQGKELSCTT